MKRKLLAFFMLFSFLVMNSAPIFAQETRIEHLPSVEGAAVNLVKITDYSSVIQRENFLEIAYSENFNSKFYKPGDIIQFNFSKDVRTKEGSLLIPCGSSIIAKISGLEKPKWFSRNAKVCLEFTHILLADGTNIPIAGELANSKGFLQYGGKYTAGKIVAYTLALGGIGTGLGAAIGAASCNVIPGIIIGGSVGGGVGLLSGIVSPGLHYKAKKGDKLPLKLEENLSVPRQ